MVKSVCKTLFTKERKVEACLEHNVKIKKLFHRKFLDGTAFLFLRYSIIQKTGTCKNFANSVACDSISFNVDSCPTCVSGIRFFS